MGKKVKIVVERFDQGITTRWYAPGEETKNLAANGDEHIVIGQDVWSDVCEIMDREQTDKVLVRIEYEAATS